MLEAQDLPPTDLTLEQFRAALGPPLGLRRVRQQGRVIAAIGRWRHEGGRIGLASIETTRLIFSLNGGQALRWRSWQGATSAIARCGSVSVAGHGIDATLEIHGRGDTLQILIDPQWLRRSARAERRQRTEAEHARRRLALSAQALVALTASSDRHPRDRRSRRTSDDPVTKHAGRSRAGWIGACDPLQDQVFGRRTAGA